MNTRRSLSGWTATALMTPQSKPCVRPAGRNASQPRQRKPRLDGAARAIALSCGMRDEDMTHLRRCIELATEALEAGDDPFGSVLVGADGRVLAEDRNRVVSGDATKHPEIELARWAAVRLSPAERAGAAVYTSGEHCPMCSSAHAWAGLGRIVFISSSAQLAAWLADLGVPPSPVRPLTIGDVAPGIRTEGPIPELAEEVHALHVRARRRQALPSKAGSPRSPRSPRETVRTWVERFNAVDVDGLIALYHEDATNHQVASEPVVGREAIRAMFTREFAAAKMVCIVENIFEDAPWAILEWRDPLGLRGCGFFHVEDGRIRFQRGYWDKLSFLRMHGLPLPTA